MKQWTLKRLRDERNLTQKDMAKILEISAFSYMRKENGQTSFLDYEMFIIRGFLNKSIEEIFLDPNCNEVAINGKVN